MKEKEEEEEVVVEEEEEEEEEDTTYSTRHDSPRHGTQHTRAAQHTQER